MEKTLISYPYKPGKLISLLCLFFFLLLSYSSFELVQANDTGLIIVFIRHVLELQLSPFQANLFHWACFSILILLSCLSILGLYRAFDSKAKVILTDTEILIPFLHSGNFIKIPFSEILSFREFKIKRMCFLEITHQKGKNSIGSSWLPKKALQEIIDILKLKVSEINISKI